MLGLWLGSPRPASADFAHADAYDFTLDTTGLAPGAGGAGFADATDFPLDTTDTVPGAGGLAFSDSFDFTLDTLDSTPGIGGLARADSADFVLNTLAAGEGESADFTLDTTDTVPGTGGLAMGDSIDFTLDTTGLTPGAGGAGMADSADFTLNTLGAVPGSGGMTFADSADFVLNTADFVPGAGGFAHADSAIFPLETTDPVPGDVDALDAGIAGLEVLCSAVQPDGKIIIAGDFTSVLGVPRANVARLNPDGTLDAGFDPKADNWVYCVVVQTDGKILLGGAFTTLQPNGAPSPTTRNKLARLNADGSLDPGFNPNPNDAVVCMAVQTDGKILIGGYFENLIPSGAGIPALRNHIARLNADGSPDTGFDPNANGVVSCLALQTDGSVLLGGEFTALQPNGATGLTGRLRIARVDSTGAVDAGFNPRANSTVSSVAVQADGKVLLGGYFTTLQPGGDVSATPRHHIARVHADGALDTGFDPKANQAIIGMAVQADGQVLIGGLFTTLQPNGAATPTTRNYAARLHADGTLDGDFDPNADISVFGTELQADGGVLLVGYFSTLQANGRGAPVARKGFARLLNDPATQSLGVPGAGRVRWLRGGSLPETQQAFFEVSTDGGAVYTPLGVGTRIPGGWELTGLSLPASGHLRARARTTAGIYNGSGGLVQYATTFNGVLTPVENWRLVYFGSSANEGNGADAHDFDGDGHVNLVEFAFGMDPTRANVGGVRPGMSVGGGSFTRSFTQPAGVGGILYGAEWTPSLLFPVWTPIPDTGIAPEHIFSVPVGGEARMFMRLTVTKP